VRLWPEDIAFIRSDKRPQRTLGLSVLTHFIKLARITAVGKDGGAKGTGGRKATSTSSVGESREWKQKNANLSNPSELPSITSR